MYSTKQFVSVDRWAYSAPSATVVTMKVDGPLCDSVEGTEIDDWIDDTETVLNF